MTRPVDPADLIRQASARFGAAPPSNRASPLPAAPGISNRVQAARDRHANQREAKRQALAATDNRIRIAASIPRVSLLDGRVVGALEHGEPK